MSSVLFKHRTQVARLALYVALFTGLTLMVSCNKSETSALAQKTFSSPAEAGAAFLEAAKSNDQAALASRCSVQIPRTSCFPAMQ